MLKKAYAPLLVAAALLLPAVGALPASAAAAPVGHLDAVTSSNPGIVRVTGWAYDDDITAAGINVVVYANGVGLTTVPTLQDRPDVTALGKGTGHAFSRTFQAPPPGRTTFCLYALGVDGSGVPDSLNTTLGCQTLNLRNSGTPNGSLDQVTPGAGGVAVRGWAYDPDAIGAAVDIHVYVDPGTPAQAATAFVPGTGVSRPDVMAAVGSGENAGYDVSVAAGAGPHRVCAYAINRTGTPGENKTLGCVRLVVPA